MQSYYAMKTRYFVIQLAKGVSLIGVSACIAVAIILEMMQKYDAASRMAYIIGLVICAFILLAGVYLFVSAYRFERAMFGRSSKEDFLQIQKELSGENAVSIRDFIVTDHFVLIYVKQFMGYCRLIRMKDIIACFENPVYGTVDKINDYTISIYDKRFELYQIVLQEDAARDANAGVRRILALKPWILHEDREDFAKRRVTAEGRRGLLKELENRRYGGASTEQLEGEPREETKTKAPAGKKKSRSLLNGNPLRKRKQ